MEMFATIIAQKLNKSKGFTCVLIPTKGWSDADREGMALFDPAVDRIFTNRLKRLLDPRIPVEEMDAHISDRAFAERGVEILDEMMQEKARGTART